MLWDLQNSKRTSEVEPRVVGDHTSILKSKLGNFKLESLQALNNGGWRLKIASTPFLFFGVYVSSSLKIKQEYIYMDYPGLPGHLALFH